MRGVDLTAELDPATGAVVLPFDRFTSSTNDMITIGGATSALISHCAAESGVDFTPAAPATQPEYDSESYFGPWTIDQAERFGFVTPMSSADLAANDIVFEETTASQLTPQLPTESATTANSALSDADWDVIDTCGESDEIQQLRAALGIADGPWAELLRGVSDGLTDQPEVQSAITDLGSCFAASGLDADPTSPWLPVGYNESVISEQQVALALRVVECKEQTSFTDRVAQVEAREQAPIVVTYLDELLDKRSALDEALEVASSLLSKS